MGLSVTPKRSATPEELDAIHRLVVGRHRVIKRQLIGGKPEPPRPLVCVPHFLPDLQHRLDDGGRVDEGLWCF